MYLYVIVCVSVCLYVCIIVRLYVCTIHACAYRSAGR